MNNNNLSPYSRWQLECYGNILAPNGLDYINPGNDQDAPEDQTTASEEAYIFSQLNPE